MSGSVGGWSSLGIGVGMAEPGMLCQISRRLLVNFTGSPPMG